MKISPVRVYNIQTNNKNQKINNQSQIQFQGLKGAKWGAAIFGTAATIGAISGSIIMTGGISAIPLLAAYVGIGAGSGALIGHTIEKGAKEFDKQNGEIK